MKLYMEERQLFLMDKKETTEINIKQIPFKVMKTEVGQKTEAVPSWRPLSEHKRKTKPWAVYKTKPMTYRLSK